MPAAPRAAEKRQALAHGRGLAACLANGTAPLKTGKGPRLDVQQRCQKRQQQEPAAMAPATLALLLLGALAGPYEAQLPATQPFTGGVGGYKTYRIPSLLHLTNGDLLLFCEARGPEQHGLLPEASTTDGGPTDVVTRRSTDGGQSWGEISVVHTETTPAKVITIGNPAPVALTSHPGTIVLTFCRNNLAMGVMNSTDNGATWGVPTYVIDTQSPSFRKLLAAPADKKISHIATGPPTSIQLQTGRIIVPTAFCYNGGPGRCRSSKPGDWFAAALYSASTQAIRLWWGVVDSWIFFDRLLVVAG